MDDHLKEALDIVKAQASVRIMSEDEIISMVRRLSSDIKNVAEGEGCAEELASSDVQSDPRKSIKEKSITCMECGKTFKILTRKHLASHNLDAAEYREVGPQEGYPAGLQGPSARTPQEDEGYEALGKAP